MRIIVEPEQEIVRLDIPMYNLPLMQVLDPVQHLIAQHERTLQRHNLITINKNILNTGSQQIHQHDIILSLSRNSMDFRNADNPGRRVQVFVHLGFEVELGEFCVYLLQLCGVLFARVVLVLREVDLAECAGS